MISDSLFEQQLRDLKVEAYEAVPYSWPLRIFTEFWESVTEMIERGRKNGSDVGLDMFKSLSEQEWREALVALVSDDKLRTSMGTAGRKRAVDTYSIQFQGRRVTGLLLDVAGRGTSR